MKTNFKKTLAVLLAVLMLSSVFSVTAFAAKYTVVYKPGEGVEGKEEAVGYNLTHTVKGATYTREHYTQTGWVRESDGTVVTFGSKLKKESVTLLPLWKGDVYKLTYAPGAYGTGTVVEVEAEYGTTQGLLGAIFTRDEYVQLGWSLVDGGEMVYELGKSSDVITGDITLYPYWAKICNIVFTPGDFGEGEEVSISVETGSAFGTKDAIFTREGYRQVGWSLTEGGKQVYNLAQTGIIAETDLVLYPVWLKNDYKIDVSTDELYFGDLCEDYDVPEAKTFTITNTGNVPITLGFTDIYNFDISLSGSNLLASGDDVTVTVQPLDDMGIGDFTELLTVSTLEDSSIIETVNIVFSVSAHVFGLYESDGNATYKANGTKTAECVKGCGKKDVVEDPNSMKKYSADNNDAKGLADSYVHHRTVRFNAFGSGMDAVDEKEVGKRFRPISWHVNDEFKGEFTGNKYENGYDVTFTHTVFGEYTLTINYVEEKYDETKEEWVATDVTDTKTFDYTVGTTAEEEQEIVRPNTILNIIFGLFAKLLALLGLGG